MKAPLLSIASLAAVFLIACGPSEAEMKANKEKATADSLATAAAMVHAYTIDPADSKVMWKGSMVGIYDHEGTIVPSKGEFKLQGGQLTGGMIVIDMTTITATDGNFNEKEGKTPDKLQGHLASPDFFDVANHPTATAEILEVNGNTATVNLTIRGVTNKETIENIQMTENDGHTHLQGTLTFDRQKYGVAYAMTMKDMVISNDITINFDVHGTKASS